MRTGTLIDPAFVGVDHRELGWPTLDRAGVVDTLRGYADLSTDFFMNTRKVFVHGRCLLVVLDVWGTTLDGISVERVQHLVITVSASGRMATFDIYDDADFAAALARFDELVAEAPADARTAHAENMSTRMVQEWARHTGAGRFDEAARYLRPDIVRRDFSTVVSFPTLEGNESFEELVKEAAEVGYRSLTVEPLAVRGERLHLGRTTIRTPEGFETVSLYVNECDDDGRVCYSAQYDEHDLAVALEELDARYHAGEGAEQALGAAERVARPGLDNAALRLEAKMLAGLEAFLRTGDQAHLMANVGDISDDFVAESRRAIVAAPDQDALGVAGIFAAMRTQGYVRASDEPVATRGDRLAVTTWTLRTASGDETRNRLVVELDGDGRYAWSCLFDADDLDDALREMDAAVSRRRGCPARRPARGVHALRRPRPPERSGRSPRHPGAGPGRRRPPADRVRRRRPRPLPRHARDAVAGREHRDEHHPLGRDRRLRGARGERDAPDHARRQ